jgi:hypothetical protein
MNTSNKCGFIVVRLNGHTAQATPATVAQFRLKLKGASRLARQLSPMVDHAQIQAQPGEFRRLTYIMGAVLQ